MPDEEAAVLDAPATATETADAPQETPPADLSDAEPPVTEAAVASAAEPSSTESPANAAEEEYDQFPIGDLAEAPQSNPQQAAFAKNFRAYQGAVGSLDFDNPETGQKQLQGALDTAYTGLQVAYDDIGKLSDTVEQIVGYLRQREGQERYLGSVASQTNQSREHVRQTYNKLFAEGMKVSGGNRAHAEFYARGAMKNGTAASGSTAATASPAKPKPSASIGPPKAAPVPAKAGTGTASVASGSSVAPRSGLSAGQILARKLAKAKGGGPHGRV